MKSKIFIKFKSSRLAITVSAALIIAFLGVTFWGNVTLDVERIELESGKINGEVFKVAHVSDYHNTKIKSLTESVLRALKSEKPDAVFITGDLVDSRKTDIAKSLDFVKQVIELAPVYYVTGNHECNVSIDNQSAYDNMIEELKAMGVHVLSNEAESVELKNGEKINVFGIKDPYFVCSSSTEVTAATDSLCSFLDVENGALNILLAHHPEQLPVYSKYGFDIVYSGHAHGGQARIFGIGLAAPDQGFFPKYSAGVYELGATQLVVSRGIGNSIIPIRFFDRPHLIITEIK